jgi:TonB family protein
VAISQEFPPWVPVDAVSRQTEFVGSVRVRILASGAVESAEILQPVHPAYDRALLLAARAWQYEPARQNGVPVPAEHVVEVRLRPRE